MAPTEASRSGMKEVGMIFSSSPHFFSSRATVSHSSQVAGGAVAPTAPKWSVRQLKLMFSKL